MDASNDETAVTPSPGPDEQLADERALLRRYAADPTPGGARGAGRALHAAGPPPRVALRGGAEPFDDLVQVASVGLVKAIDRFDPERGTAFSTFAVPTILGELKRHFRDRGWSVHVPRDVQERILKVERALAELPARLGRAATVDDIAERLERHRGGGAGGDARLAGAPRRLARRVPTMADGEEPAPLGERIGEEDLGFDTVEYGAAIEPALAEISERDRKVLHLRFVEDMTQSEIAERVGVSQMHVSRILRSTLEKLRERRRRGATRRDARRRRGEA